MIQGRELINVKMVERALFLKLLVQEEKLYIRARLAKHNGPNSSPKYVCQPMSPGTNLSLP